MKHPRDFAPLKRGDKRRFHAREFSPRPGVHVYEVYHAGSLDHICECQTVEMADMVADALEAIGEKCTCPILDGFNVVGSSCPIHGLEEVAWQ